MSVFGYSDERILKDVADIIATGLRDAARIRAEADIKVAQMHSGLRLTPDGKMLDIIPVNHPPQQNKVEG